MIATSFRDSAGADRVDLEPRAAGAEDRHRDATQPACDDDLEMLAPMSRPTLPGVRRERFRNLTDPYLPAEPRHTNMNASAGRQLGEVIGTVSTMIRVTAMCGGVNLRKRSAFETTVTEDTAIAAAARIGLSRMPVDG